MAPSEGLDLVYVTYHVDVGETPFFVALDHSRRAIVISIRGTLSMKVGYLMYICIMPDINAVYPVHHIAIQHRILQCYMIYNDVILIFLITLHP